MRTTKAMSREQLVDLGGDANSAPSRIVPLAGGTVVAGMLAGRCQHPSSVPDVRSGNAV